MDSAPKDLQLVELHIENVKKIRALTIRPNGNVVVLAGENGQGKSSAIDAWEYLLGGAATHPEEVIRRGEKSATVRGTLADSDAAQFVVERKWAKERGTELTVKLKEGGKVPGGAQAWVDARINKLSFDPQAFLRLSPKDQVKTLRELVGVDTTLIEAAHAALFARRTEVTTTGKAMKARFDALPVPPTDTPDEPVSVDQLLNEQAELQMKKQTNDQVRARVGSAQTHEASFRRAMEAAESDCDRLSAELEKAQTRHHDAAQATAKAATARIEAEKVAAELVDPDVAEVVRRISRADSTNQAVRAKKERAALHEQLELKRKEQKDLGDKLESLDADRLALLASAKFPVPGLSFTNDGLTFNDLPFNQASSAEQLKVGVAVGFALNPALKFVRIKDGSLLDEKSMAMVAELAARANGLVLIERVGTSDTGPCVIVIEDGEQAEQLETKPAA